MIKPSGTDSTVITDGLYYCNLFVDISTEHPEPWRKWFANTSEDAGLDSSAYGITPTATGLQVYFHSTETVSSSDTVMFHNVTLLRLWLTRAETRINLESGL